MDGGAGRAALEELLVLFITRALGLTLVGERSSAMSLPGPQLGDGAAIEAGVAVQAEWKTDRGSVKIRGIYDRAQSQRVGAHVLFIEWWMGPSTHHASWWRSCAQRPGEWTVGHGRALAAEAEPAVKSGQLGRYATANESKIPA
jgi:hypothetical protein